MDITAIDRSATSGDSWLHRAAPVAKLLSFAMVLAAVVVSWNPFVILGTGLALAAAVASARVDARLAAGLAAYPALFAVIFAFASAPDALIATTIVLKASVAALAAVTVVLTTPYPHVFAPVQRVVPSVVGDALLMTYRSFFILAEKFGHLLRSVRLRSGLRRGHPLRSARAVVTSLGGLLLYSFDLAQRDYDVMRLRGYERRLRAGTPPDSSRLAGASALAVAAMLLGVSVVWRVSSAALNPYSWLVPIVPAAAFVAAALSRRTR